MLFLFPHDYFDKKIPEELYASEYKIAQDMGCPVMLLDFDVILAGGDPFTGKDIPSGEPAVWRGWQMPVETYGRFYEHATEHGIDMLTTPEAYAACHELASSYPLCESRAVPTVFADTSAVSAAIVPDVFAELECSSLFVKDAVKGAYDCPCRLDADDKDGWQSELDRLFWDRGAALADSIVFRRWEELSGETRFFVVDGTPCCTQEHSVGDGSVGLEECKRVLADTELVGTSPFFTIDLARTATGDVVVVETGDGQVSECLPECQEELIEHVARL